MTAVGPSMAPQGSEGSKKIDARTQEIGENRYFPPSSSDSPPPASQKIAVPLTNVPAELARYVGPLGIEGAKEGLT